MIDLTVALPMYKSKEIAWLALESLCRQKDIDFEWELLIAEEAEEECYGLEKIKEYVPRLKQIGCVRLEYISLKDWLPLSLKWNTLADASSKTSQSFLLQAADCYAQPYRLKETHDIFKKDKNIDWVQSKKGFFYNIEGQESAIFDHQYSIYHSPGQTHPCSLNMATKTSLIKKLPRKKVKRSVDSFIFEALTLQKGTPLEVAWNSSDNWKYGFDTDGLNNISIDRGIMIKIHTPPFVALPAGERLEKYIPSDIISKLDTAKIIRAANQNKTLPL